MAYFNIIHHELQENNSFSKIKSIKTYFYETVEELGDLTNKNIASNYSLHSYNTRKFDIKGNLKERIDYENSLISVREIFTYDKNNSVFQIIEEDHIGYIEKIISKQHIFTYNEEDNLINKTTYQHKYSRYGNSVYPSPNYDWLNNQENRGYGKFDFSNNSFYFISETSNYNYFHWGKEEKIVSYDIDGNLVNENVFNYDTNGNLLESDEFKIVANNKKLNAKRKITKGVNKIYDDRENLIEVFECDNQLNITHKRRYIFDNDNKEIGYLKYENEVLVYKSINIYNSVGELSEVQSYDGNENLLKLKQYKFDEKFNYIEKRIYWLGILESLHLRKIEYYE